MGTSPGDRFGPYEIVGVIGAGGMGEVYRAHDPRMGRDVALKLSREQFSERFDREVRAVAALSHQNICTIYDVGPNYYVMELVEGPTLEDRIQQGPIPEKEALQIAGQIADALEGAHEKGIVHRDLKPANIKLRPDGTVKVLDFGLAKLGALPESSAGAASQTVTMGATQTGTILGTPAYMSPEQARGATMDRRTDTWAFGAVLYEMVTGRQAFAGETVTDILAAVLQRDPDWAPVPETLLPLLHRCLEKDAKRRLREAVDGMLLLQTGAQPAPAPAGKAFGLISSATAAVLLLALATVSFVHFREKSRPAEMVRLQFALPPRVTFSRSGIFAISPDGRKVAFSAFGADGVPRIWIRDLGSSTARPLSNVETSQSLYALFWSPDSLFVAVQSEGKLKKVDVASGAAREICDAPGQVLGGSWSRDDVILFANAAIGIIRVSAGGGTPAPLEAFTRDKLSTPIYPVFLPDGRHFLYSRAAGGASRKDYRRGIYIGALDTKPGQPSGAALVKTDYSFAYVPNSGPVSGHLLFLNGGTLFAQPFDEKRMTLAGEPVPVAEQVATDDNAGFGYISASQNGSLVYLPAASRNLQLTWFNRHGEVIEKPAVSPEFVQVKLSPDGTKAAIVQRQIFGAQASSVWIVDLLRGTTTRFTFGSGNDSLPVWSPDGSRIAWRSIRDGKVLIYQKAANGSGNEELLYDSGNAAPTLTDWSRDGRFLIYDLNRDLWALPVGPGSSSDRKPIRLIQSAANKYGSYLSPDGRWIAYISDESGSTEIYVQGVNLSSYNAGKWMVSKGAVGLVRWRTNGKELMYLGPDGGVMSVALTEGAVFQPNSPQVLFKLPPEFLRLSSVPGALADITRDQEKVLVSMPVRESGRQELSVVLNWQAGLPKQLSHE